MDFPHFYCYNTIIKYFIFLYKAILLLNKMYKEGYTMSMTPKENYLAALKHEPYEYVPNYVTDNICAGFGASAGPAFEKGTPGGPDGFGVIWETPSSGGGAPIPKPDSFILDSESIVDWKKIVKFPDLGKVDWEEISKRELSMGNPDIQAIDFGSGNGPFERLAALMGFEEALMALAIEPEATGDLLNAIGDYKIDVIELVKKYYHADTFTNYDDIATERGTFMSPETYRKLIKPVHKRINDAVKAFDMIPIQHTCGKADSLIEDYIDTGAACWTSVQPTNDIVNVLKKYGDKICLMGGYNSNGLPGRPDATPEIVEKEVQRNFETYASLPGFIFFGFRLVNSLDPKDTFDAMAPIIQSYMKWKNLIKPDFS